MKEETIEKTFLFSTKNIYIIDGIYSSQNDRTWAVDRAETSKRGCSCSFEEKAFGTDQMFQKHEGKSHIHHLQNNPRSTISASRNNWNWLEILGKITVYSKKPRKSKAEDRRIFPTTCSHFLQDRKGRWLTTTITHLTILLSIHSITVFEMNFLGPSTGIKCSKQNIGFVSHIWRVCRHHGHLRCLNQSTISYVRKELKSIKISTFVENWTEN